ncbi:MAG: FAD-dependent oxidoreductase, partial [Candidatus Omnitrophica bacterium]|nr:FAD-dependent oxidoreductase [Candidatus Omnitrophota bacterium]
PLELPGIKFDHKRIVSSDDLLSLNRIPKSMIIVGGGAVGCEFASLFSFLGTSVEIVELMDSLLPREDKEISKALEMSFKKRGIVIKTKTGLESVNSSPDGIEAIFSDKTKNSSELVLICVGRKPNTDNLNLESLGITLEKGWVKTDLYLRTNVNNIYAIGDVTGKTLLAHVASRQAEAAIENIIGKKKIMDYLVIPNCVFSYPQIASVGLSEEEARERKINYIIGKFSFRALGKAHTVAETEGFVKLIFDKDTHIILGAHIIGAEATELISVLTLAIKNKLKAEDIKETVFPHPTFSEAIHEAVFAFFKKPLHAV